MRSKMPSCRMNVIQVLLPDGPCAEHHPAPSPLFTIMSFSPQRPPMGLLNLIQGLGTRHSQEYTDFLDACAKLRQMRCIEANLATIARCLTTVRAATQSKCIEYYITHDLDRIILQLHAQTDLEDFFCLVLPVLGEDYLRSEFCKVVWKYGSFHRLCKAYCEQCVMHGVFNRDLAQHLVGMFTKSKDVRDGLILVCKLKEYAFFFEELSLGKAIADRVNDLLNEMSDGVFELLDLLCYYEDVSGVSLVDEISLAGNGARSSCIIYFDQDTRPGESTERDGVYVKKGAEGDAVYTRQDGHCAESPGRSTAEDKPDPAPPYKNRLVFLAAIFRKVKSQALRNRTVMAALAFVTDRYFSEFLTECILNDPGVISDLLSSKMKRADWSPLGVYEMLVEGGWAAMRNEEEDGIDKSIVDAARSVKTRRPNKFPLLERLLDGNFEDHRIYLFLYMANKAVFYSHFGRIFKVCKNKAWLIKAIENGQ